MKEPFLLFNDGSYFLKCIRIINILLLSANKYKNTEKVNTMEETYAVQNMTDEIDLRELLLVLWKKKILIICFTIAAALLTGIISVIFLSPVYHSVLNVIINMPDTYSTKYGEYNLPLTTNDQYINLITSNDILIQTIKDMGYDESTTIESLRDRIKVETTAANNNVEQNSFNIKVAANNPEEARDLAQTLFSNYMDYLNFFTIEGAVNYYIDKYTVEISSLKDSMEMTKEILAKNEVLLAETPKTINQKAAMNEIDKLPNTSDYVVLENVINPNYTQIEHDIIENKQSINDMENSINTYNQYLEELNSVKEIIENYNFGDNLDIKSNEFKSLAETYIHLTSTPVAPTRKTSPNNLRNVLIGTAFGFLFGLVIVFIKEFIFKPEQ